MQKHTIIEDKQILDLLKIGDEKAITMMYEKYAEKLYISAYNMLKNKEASEDIIQEVFISIWNKKETLEVKTTLKSYLYACVAYKVYSHFRKNKENFKVELLEGFNTQVQYLNPETKLIQDEFINHINSIIDALPPRCKQVFQMSREEQLSHKEIALKLNISTKTIETHITKAIKALRTSLGKSYSIELIAFIYYTLY